MVVALKPLHDYAAKIKRVVVATYQSVSGAGQGRHGRAVRAVAATSSWVIGAEAKKFTKQIAFNVIPHIDDLPR